MRKIYFIRHGQTEWNRTHLICGVTDIPLTEKGHQQAVEAGERIRSSGIRIDEILYSPLKRAADTARHIQEATGVPMRPEPRLTEQNFGDFEGTDKRFGDFQRARSQFALHFGNGESMLQLAHRVYSLLDELVDDPEEKTCLLVAHNGVGRSIHSYFCDLTNEEYANHSSGNCEIVEYHFR